MLSLPEYPVVESAILMTIHLRPVTEQDSYALGVVLVKAEQRTFAGRVPADCLNFTIAESAANWRTSFEGGFPEHDDVVLVATTSDAQLVGFAWGASVAETLAELKMISVLPAYHRQGIGRQLVTQIAHTLSERGFTRMDVRMLQINPNRHFYERLGAQLVDVAVYHWFGVACIECRYRWPNLNIF